MPTLHATTTRKKKPFVGALTTGVPCVLETSVGLLAALVEPASPPLRVSKPTGTSARDITLALSSANKLRRVTRCTPLHEDRSLLTCNRCGRDITGRTVYMYTSMGFCSRNCRYEYRVDEVEKRRKRLAVTVMEHITKMPRIVTRMAAGKAAGEVSRRPTFFTCVEAGSLA